MWPTPQLLASNIAKRSYDEFRRWTRAGESMLATIFCGRAFELMDFAAVSLEALDLPKRRYQLVDFSNPDAVQECKTLSDAFIGGSSTSFLDHVPKIAAEPPHARFHGNISIDLPVGKPDVFSTCFSACRTLYRPPTIFGKSLWDIDSYEFLALRIKSDGRKYLVNLQSETIVHTDIHQHRLFAKRPGQWETVLINWGDFVRTNNGMVVEPQNEILRQKVRTVGIGSTNRMPGPFELCISSIWATSSDIEAAHVGDREVDVNRQGSVADGSAQPHS